MAIRPRSRRSRRITARRAWADRPVSVRLASGDDAAIYRVAAALGISMSALMRDAIARALREHEASDGMMPSEHQA